MLTNFDKLDKRTFKPILSVNGKLGNSSYVSGVLTDFGGDPGNWKLYFTTITSGLFNVIINEDHYEVLDSSLHFQVEPGLDFVYIPFRELNFLCFLCINKQ